MEFAEGKQEDRLKNIPLDNFCEYNLTIRNGPRVVKSITSGRLRLNSDKGFKTLTVIALCKDILITSNSWCVILEGKNY